MRLVVTLIGLSLSVAAVPAEAQQGEVTKILQDQLLNNAKVDSTPGRIAYTSHVEVMATIVSIDPKSRDVELKGPRGETRTITAGPEVQNFDQMKVGDTVVAEYRQSITLTLDKGQQGTVGRTESSLFDKAKPGEKPSASSGNFVELVGQIVELDKATRVAVIRGPDQVMELDIPEAEQFARLSVGDMVTLSISEAIAVDVQPAESGK